MIDHPDQAPWAGLLDWGSAIMGPRDWWPPPAPTVLGVALGALLGEPRVAPGRPASRPRHFPDAGITILSSQPRRVVPGEAFPGPEIWCRCDSGPLGFLSIAAHGHADALAIEVRHDGVEILVDPGTYCYHGEPEWRSYFRSTRAHNTLELDRTSQAVEGGPFLWSSAVPTELVEVDLDSQVTSWTARHSGYDRLSGSPVHERTVRLHRLSRRIQVFDQVRRGEGHEVRLFFHLGPTVALELDGSRAGLVWNGRDGTRQRASLALPTALQWSEHHGETDPVLGWYSPRFGVRQPISTLVGTGICGDSIGVTDLTFHGPDGRE